MSIYYRLYITNIGIHKKKEIRGRLRNDCKFWWTDKRSVIFESEIYVFSALLYFTVIFIIIIKYINNCYNHVFFQYDIYKKKTINLPLLRLWKPSPISKKYINPKCKNLKKLINIRSRNEKFISILKTELLNSII